MWKRNNGFIVLIIFLVYHILSIDWKAHVGRQNEKKRKFLGTERILRMMNKYLMDSLKKMGPIPPLRIGTYRV